MKAELAQSDESDLRNYIQTVYIVKIKHQKQAEGGV
jgi:hypothetical protein